mgnify:CR=1 FL=1
MDKSMIKGFAVGGIAMVVLGAGAVTGYKSMTGPPLAEVVAVKEVMETVVNPRERREAVQVQHQAPVKDNNRIAGTVVGGVAGGLLGSAFGGGNGKTLATVAGAAAGGFAGNQVENSMQQRDGVTPSGHRSKMAKEQAQRLAGQASLAEKVAGA